MILLLIIAVPICVELAAWAVDASFETYILNWRPFGDAEPAIENPDQRTPVA